MAIMSFSKSVTWQQIVQTTDKLATNMAVPGEVTAHGTDNDNVLDSMVDVQDTINAPISWHSLTRAIARGTSYNHQHGGNDRHIVIDTDLADGADIVDAINWMHDA